MRRKVQVKRKREGCRRAASNLLAAHQADESDECVERIGQ